MNNFNIYALVSFIIRLVSLSVLLFYIIPKQFSEVLRPRNWLTGLRWQILLLFIFSVTSAIPSVVYLGFRVYGYQSAVAQNIASISGNLSTLATTILLVLVYNYRARD